MSGRISRMNSVRKDAQKVDPSQGERPGNSKNSPSVKLTKYDDPVKNPSRLSPEEIDAMFKRGEIYMHRPDASTFTSPMWELGLRMLYRKSDNSRIINWHRCSHCDRNFLYGPKDGPSNMLKHMRNHFNEIIPITRNQLAKALERAVKFGENYGLISLATFIRLLPHRHEGW